jgi:hypothetical protein
MNALDSAIRERFIIIAKAEGLNIKDANTDYHTDEFEDPTTDNRWLEYKRLRMIEVSNELTKV